MNTLTDWIIVFFIIQIVHFFGTYKLYKKANRKSWEAAIPVYNLLIMLKIIKRPIWWIFLFFLPVIFIIMYIILCIEFIQCFGKRKYSDILILIMSLGVYIYFINYSKNIFYTSPIRKEENTFSSLIFATIFSSIVHIYFLQPFTIPTSSMEKTLLVGDFIFVSKIHYGLRIPITPIVIPFFHNIIPYLGVKSYINSVRLPYIRMPAINKIKHNDIIVFNYPQDKNHSSPDRKDNYIKRCIALPGDVLIIKNGNFIINNNKLIYKAVNKQYEYIVKTIDVPLNIEYLKYDMDIHDIKYLGEIINKNNIIYNYAVNINIQDYHKLKQFDNIIYIKKNILPLNFIETNIYPKNFKWNRDFYGPIRIPKKGDKIFLNYKNINIYKIIIDKYENNNFFIKNNKIYINGICTNYYTIKQDYYFMTGDNIHNSLDSRYFGFVPEDHIIGKPILIWLSINWDRDDPINIFKWKLRINRFMKLLQ